MFDQDKAEAAIKRWLANVRRHWWVVLLIIAAALFAVFWSEKTKINLWASKINPQTLEFYKAIGTVLVAVIAAVIAGGLQYRQWQTAHKQWQTAQQKLKFELFDRRFAVYKAISVLPFEIIETGDVLTARRNYAKAIEQVDWLFDKDLTYYLWMVYPENAVKYTNGLFDLQGHPDFEKQRIYRKMYKNYEEWHEKEFEFIKTSFTPFLQLEVI